MCNFIIDNVKICWFTRQYFSFCGCIIIFKRFAYLSFIKHKFHKKRTQINIRSIRFNLNFLLNSKRDREGEGEKERGERAHKAIKAPYKYFT